MGIARASSNLVRVDLRHPLDSSSLYFLFFSLATGKEGRAPQLWFTARRAARASRDAADLRRVGLDLRRVGLDLRRVGEGRRVGGPRRDRRLGVRRADRFGSARDDRPVLPPSSSSTGGLVDVLLLDDAAACAAHLGPLIAARDPVAVDFEGVALGRSGRLCLAQVAPSNGPTLLVDVCAMGAAAFRRGRLGELLEDARVLKLVFDCRSDSAALHHQFGVKMRGVYDVQVAYCLKRDEEEGARVSTLQGPRARSGSARAWTTRAERRWRR